MMRRVAHRTQLWLACRINSFEKDRCESRSVPIKMRRYGSFITATTSRRLSLSLRLASPYQKINEEKPSRCMMESINIWLATLINDHFLLVSVNIDRVLAAYEQIRSCVWNSSSHPGASRSSIRSASSHPSTFITNQPWVMMHLVDDDILDGFFVLLSLGSLNY